LNATVESAIVAGVTDGADGLLGLLATITPIIFGVVIAGVAIMFGWKWLGRMRKA